MPQEIVTFGPSFCGATLIVLVHLFIHRSRFLKGQQNPWPDFLAGIALGYLFVEIFPHLASFQQKLLAAADGGPLGFLEHHAYLMAAAGFLVHLAIGLSGERARSQRVPETISIGNLPLAVGLSAFSLAAYAFLIGYMLAEQPTHRAGAGIGFGVAMAAHFVGLDHFYRDRYPQLWDAALRYVLAGAVYGGWIFGVTGELSDPVYALAFTFLAGGLIVATPLFELPRVKSWRSYASFCAGAIVFSALILFVQHFDL
ncbi:MAG: hypothetical protein JRH01_14385 [Deltaproteobacteria bacterium]|nr:hypothetical protein [Deltaproteobacteria bacterium]